MLPFACDSEEGKYYNSMSKCHFLSSYCVVSKVQGAGLEAENTVYMLEPSILRYDRAEHEDIHLSCGSHIACFGVKI